MRTTWRLLVELRPASGPWNMAVDEALLASVAAGGRPALRLYRWRGPWLSLGYAQALPEPRARACREAGVGLVRRVTGGRAVLHGADLTYAVVAPVALLPEGLEGSYRAIAAGLVAALEALGIEVERAPAPARPLAPHGAFDCFLEPAADEISAGGRKLVGSAQRRLAAAGDAQGSRTGRSGVRVPALLQHGSIRVEPDPPAATAAAGLAGVATSLAELGVPAARRRALREDVPRALGAALGVRFAPDVLTPAERRAALAGAAALRREPLHRRTGVTLSASRGR